MITLRQGVAPVAQGAQLAKSSFKEFALSCIAAGYTMFHEWLNPAAGKAPCLFFTNPTTNLSHIVVLSKSVAALRASGKLPDAALKSLSIIDGKNAAGEQRYYLSSNGFNEITVEQAIAIGENYTKTVEKLSMEKMAALIA